MLLHLFIYFVCVHMSVYVCVDQCDVAEANFLSQFSPSTS